MSTISKTTFTFTVLHRTDDPFREGLFEALARSQDGHAVGMETEHTSVPVLPQDVENELVALYNDGQFFNDDLSEEIRAGQLEIGDWFREDSDEWHEIVDLNQHGDTMLVIYDHEQETTFDIDTVIDRRIKEDA